MIPPETISVLLAAVPGIEAMWASAYLICAGALALVPLAILINFAAVVIFVHVVERVGLPARLERFLEHRVNSRVKRFEAWFSRYGYAVILVLVALPLSGIGSYTGAFIGRTLGLRRPVFYVCIFLGIVVSVLFAFLIAYGINVIGVTC